MIVTGRLAAHCTSTVVAERLGASDCERLGSGLLAQPVNAVTSLAYVAVAAGVVVVARRSERLRTESVVLAVGLAAIGLGSFAFHGPQPTGARVAHDLPILATVWFMLCLDGARLAGRTTTPWRWFASGAIGAALATAIVPDLGAVLTAVALVGLLACEFVLRRRIGFTGVGRRSGRPALLVAVIILAAASWWFGRSDSTLCDPRSVLQLHALWHLLTAALIWVWWSGVRGRAGRVR